MKLGSVDNKESWEFQNHRITECLELHLKLDLKDHLVPSPMSWARTSSSRSGCSKPHPTWP